MTTDDAPLSYSLSLRLDATPDELWPLVCDTNLMNRLAGLPPIRTELVASADGQPRWSFRTTIAGLPATYSEEPFEWVAGERLAVERAFQAGPLARLRSAVAMAPEGDGTRLTHTLALWPRDGVGQGLAALGEGAFRESWTRAYEAAAAYVRGGRDPWLLDVAGAWSPAVRAAADRLIEAGQPHDLVERLAELVALGDESALLHMRPYALADRWGADRDEVLTLCLHAVRAGLLAPRWSLLCPHCRGPKAPAATLAELRASAECVDCALDFEGQLDRSAELAFRPAPALRHVGDVVYCAAGPGATPHVLFQGKLPAGGELALELPVVPGVYRLRASGLPEPIALIYEGGEQEGLTPWLELGETPQEAPVVAGPRLRALLVNPAAEPRRVVIERADWADDVVTAAFVGGLPLFRELFPDERLAAELLVGLMAIVACRIDGAAEACRALGPGGLETVGGWQAQLAVRLEDAGCLVFEVAGDTLLAAAYDPLDAARAALSLLDEPDAPHPALGLRIGLAAGACRAVPGEGLGAFAGEPVTAALACRRIAVRGELAMPGELADAPGLDALLAARPWRASGGEVVVGALMAAVATTA